MLPSSHASIDASRPSPQIADGVHALPGVGHSQSASIWQSTPQPSPTIRLRSSHALARVDDAVPARAGGAGSPGTRRTAGAARRAAGAAIPRPRRRCRRSCPRPRRRCHHSAVAAGVPPVAPPAPVPAVPPPRPACWPPIDPPAPPVPPAASGRSAAAAQAAVGWANAEVAQADQADVSQVPLRKQCCPSAPSASGSREQPEPAAMMTLAINARRVGANGDRSPTADQRSISPRRYRPARGVSTRAEGT